MQTLFGRPSKGRRQEAHLSIHRSHAGAVAKLCKRHSRTRTDILVGLIVTGLYHGDELGDATLKWSHGDEISLPAEYDEVVVDDEYVDMTNRKVRLLELHANAIAEYRIGVLALRSALAWIGLHHVDELPAVLDEVDDLQRRLPTGQSLGDFYVDTLAAHPATDTPGSALTALSAIRQLRAGIPAEDVAIATGLPLDLLTALSAEAISAIDGRLPLTG